jgi:Ti-type conjugative transfer relaxase TraA
LAIYHLTATIISRARGQSAVAAAAYRSTAALRDERYGITHYQSRKREILHSEILAAADAPSWVFERESLWNRVEAAEARKDAQLARLIEVGLPVELSVAEWVALLRDYIAKEFVAIGMIADFCIRADDRNPRAQIMLTLRGVTAAGFGPKERRWNGKLTLLEWRSAWAERVNEHLARAGQAVRIDHRTLAAQHIELLPGRRVGIGRPQQGLENLPSHLQERLAERQRIAHENGMAILEDPSVILGALTHERAVFTLDDLARFLSSRTAGSDQCDAALRAVTQSPETIELESAGGRGRRFTSRDMLEAAKSLSHRTVSMAGRRGHGVAVEQRALELPTLQVEWVSACEYLLNEGDAKAVVLDDAAKEPVLQATRRAWEAAGFEIRGAAPSSRAAAALESLSGVRSRAIADWEETWAAGLEPLVRRSVLLIDGAETLGLKQLERWIAVADKARAAVVLVGDAERVRAMKAETPFADVLRGIGIHGRE